MNNFVKFPRTPHLCGSAIQAGDDDLSRVPFLCLRDQPVIITEKMDGANVGISFAEDGGPLLQNRGDYLTGGAGEKQFDLLKQWASCLYVDLWNVLGNRYILFGEWLYARHTVYYTRLPHYFLAYDVYDRALHCFLSTVYFVKLLQPLPLSFAPTLFSGFLESMTDLTDLLGLSAYADEPMEGLYIREEFIHRTAGRYKFVRPGFTQRVTDSDHWSKHPIKPNKLAAGITIFGTSG